MTKTLNLALAAETALGLSLGALLSAAAGIALAALTGNLGG